MKELVAQALELQILLERQGRGFCFIGGLATQHWGEPHLTRDMNVTSLTGFGGEETFIDILLSHYESRVNESRGFALLHRILLLKTAQGTGIDIAPGGLPFEAEAIRRSQMMECAPGISLRTCTAEDLLVM